MKKKLIALLLTFSMCLSMMPVQVFAQEADEEQPSAVLEEEILLDAQEEPADEEPEEPAEEETPAEQPEEPAEEEPEEIFEAPEEEEAEEALEEATQFAEIRSFPRNSAADLRASELLYVYTEGFAPEAKLTYTYTVKGTKWYYGSGEVWVAPSYNLAIENSAYVELDASKNGNTSSPLNYAYFLVADDNHSSNFWGTNYNASLEVQVVVKDTNPDSATYNKTATCSHKGFGESSLATDAGNMVTIAFVGMERDMKAYYGLVGVGHVLCSNCTAEITKIYDTSIVNYTTARDKSKITGQKTGVTNMDITIKKERGCAFHSGTTAKYTSKAYVVNQPIVNSFGELTVTQVPAGVTLTINGQSKTSTGGDLMFEGLQPETTYTLTASVTEFGITTRADTQVTMPKRANVQVIVKPGPEAGTAQGGIANNISGTGKNVAVSVSPNPYWKVVSATCEWQYRTKNNGGYTKDTGTLTYDAGTDKYVIAYPGFGNSNYQIKDELITVTVTLVDTYVPVTGLTLDPSEKTIPYGDSFTVTPTVTPADASLKNVTWTSSDPTVCSVDENGKVTGLKVGTATVTATAADGVTATCAVTVIKRPVTVSGITAQDKVYDGTTAATLVLTGVTVNGVLAQDQAKVSATATGAFADPNVGTDKTVNLSNLAPTAMTDYYELNIAGSQKTTTADITAKDITGKVTVSGPADVIYNGQKHTPTDVTVTYEGQTLVMGRDYTLSYPEAADANVNVGKGDLTVNFIGNYAGTTSVNFNILPAEGKGSVTLDDWKVGETAKTPRTESTTNPGTPVITYKVKGADDSTYTAAVPTEIGEYTVRAVFPANNNYKEATDTDDFAILENPHTVTVSVENGTADKDAKVNVNYEKDLTITFTANENYALDTVTVDGKA
ncbi:MAG: Ig-like domain-containing protein, partial [Clostridiales bacterium]|nr:Ig-like domain-containing protein [Candidatus Apopatocola equi]